MCVLYLAVWAFLGVPLAMLDNAGPVPQHLVPLLILTALQTLVPRRVASKTPHQLALTALDLWEDAVH